MARQSAPLPMATASPSFPPADAFLAAIHRVDWIGALNRFMDCVAVCCAFMVATWRHHRIGARLATVAAIVGAFLAIVAAWAWETGRPAAIRWVRETAWPAVRRWVGDAALACRGILAPPLTV